MRGADLCVRARTPVKRHRGGKTGAGVPFYGQLPTALSRPMTLPNGAYVEKPDPPELATPPWVVAEGAVAGTRCARVGLPRRRPCRPGALSACDAWDAAGGQAHH